MENEKAVRKRTRLVLGLAIMPILVWWLMDVIAYSVQSRTTGTIYAFDLFFPSYRLRAVMFGVLFFVHFGLIMACFGGTRWSSKLWPILGTMWVAGIVYMVVFYTSFGQIIESGIKYRSPSTCYKARQLFWFQMDKPAELEISYFKMNTTRRNYICVLKIRGSDNTLATDLAIPFRDEDAHKILAKVLNLLQKNQIPVITHFRDKAFLEMSSDKEKVELLKTITILTKIE